ncbi:MAG TPA: hypothetical protein VHH09_06050 [Acidimicrobiales bacterium]|nr:hypothetical protein [Acidimicrobiales bacterium]
MRTRAFLVAAVLLVGGACSGGDGLQGVSSDPARSQPAAGQPATNVARRIPPPGATPTEAPPELPPMGALPPDTVSLEELHSQGRTHVKR